MSCMTLFVFSCCTQIVNWFDELHHQEHTIILTVTFAEIYFYLFILKLLVTCVLNQSPGNSNK